MTNDNNDLILRSPDQQEYAIKIHDSFRDELNKRQLSNTENYDKSILTLSSAGLAISLTSLNFFVPAGAVEWLCLVVVSWWCFFAAVSLSLIAYLVSNAAINKQLEIARDYYVNRLKSAENKKNLLSTVNNWLNRLVGLIFIMAIGSLVLFVTINLKMETISMSDQENKVITETVSITKSATLPSMQSVPGLESATVPVMQAVPAAPPTQASNQTQNKSSTEQK